MTLMATISNLGQVGMKSIYLWLMDILTWKSCTLSYNFNSSNLIDTTTFADSSSFVYESSSISSENSTFFNSNSSALCLDNAFKDNCTESCVTNFDGFFVANGVAVIFSVFWFYFGGRTIKKIQKLPIKSWHVMASQTESKENVSYEDVSYEDVHTRL
jgi:MFS transporter, PAT family, solute carrier family 33 (acetyl-CoA transportor), member 1